LVAGEGCFYTARKKRPFPDGSPRLRFVFAVAMANRDRSLLEALQAALGVGCISDAAPRKAHWQPISTFTVASLSAHLKATIPFAEQYLLTSAKRQQFESWRDHLLAYDQLHTPGRSICSVEGCEKFVRGRGLCRSHYYRATGY
jgi:hypothetical protein